VPRGVDRRPGGGKLAGEPKWRNWQTRRTQKAVETAFEVLPQVAISLSVMAFLAERHEPHLCSFFAVVLVALRSRLIIPIASPISSEGR
jgi:hypothetical protein